MNKIMSGILAGALSASFAASAALPANAVQMFVPQAPSASSDVQTVEARNGDPRWIRRHGNRVHRRVIHNDGMYWNGHRGYRETIAAIAGTVTFGSRLLPLPPVALIGSAIVNSENNRVYAGNAHVQWCYNHYRSYRASDNTFQP